MTKHDTHPNVTAPLAEWSDISAAIGLLTRLPVQVDMARASARGAAAAWAWPLVGVIPALLAAALGFGALACGLPGFWAAALALVGQVMITGAMHEDGLADAADGLWGGASPERRLDIMKDSHIGAYGVIALVLSLSLRAAALAVILPAQGALAALIITGLVSRVPMVALMAALPNARGRGLSQSVGRVSWRTAGLALGIAGAVTVIAAPSAVIVLGFWTTLPPLIFAGIARQKIGGQTGDILGAAQQITEIAALAVFATLLV